MNKFFRALLKVGLVLVAVAAIAWYAFGADGPFYEQGQEIAAVWSEKIKESAGWSLFDGSEDSTSDDEVNSDREIDVNEAENLEGESQNQNQEAIEEPALTPEELTTTIVFTGDVEISDYVQPNYSSGGVDAVVSEDVKALLNDADITMINNEFCFSTRGTKAPDKQYTFRVDPSYVSLLTDLGVDIAGLANNHSLDYGKEALTDTFTTLTESGIEYTGAGDSLEDASKLIVKTDAKGRTIGFLAASHVIPVASWNVQSSQPGLFCFYDETELLAAIKAAKQEVDYLFVMVHWGTEHTTELTSYQVNDGHMFIDAGADAVIGMHSHCLQGIEYYNGKPIFYSLGNFIFNSTIKSGNGGAVEVTIDENDQVTYRIVPIAAQNAKTYLAASEDSGIFSYIQGISTNVSVDEFGEISEK